LKPLPLHLLTGQHAEQYACDFLVAQGLTLVDRNFSCRYGELDLILTDQHTMVIVEVRFRQTEIFGGAIASITPKKQAKIIAATQFYLQQYPTEYTIRFDVIAISGVSGLQWIQNAFQT
jgi:putative endonuclease